MRTNRGFPAERPLWAERECSWTDWPCARRILGDDRLLEGKSGGAVRSLERLQAGWGEERWEKEKLELQ